MPNLDAIPLDGKLLLIVSRDKKCYPVIVRKTCFSDMVPVLKDADDREAQPLKVLWYRFAILCFLAAGMSACGQTQTARPSPALPPAIDPFSGLIRLYQGPLNHLDAVRRGGCPMFPSCSEYGRLAIADHGPIIGWMMAHDRLMRCGRDEIATAPRVLVNGEWKFFDPVEANDFWWNGRKRDGYRAGAVPQP